MEKIPYKSIDLISELEKHYPVRNPYPTMSLAEIMYAAGQRSVIEFLLARKEDTDVEMTLFAEKMNK